MSEAALNYVSNLMESMGIPYRFMEWTTKPPDDRYFVGEYIQPETLTREESGRQDITFILRGFTRNMWDVLIRDDETIAKNAMRTAILDDGTGIAVFYGGSSIVPTGDAQWKSIKINLKIQEWKVN